ncbi:MAG: RagB/SusD family nutrient uptake outer membrane protein [Carboxylicivirga sp.]|nr:RagB/SusD family nutrient uptake outer membrane protein [Carboxylicivirga sp.]
MKNKIYTILILLLPSIWGCETYLDESPDNRIEVNTLEKASRLLVNAYPSVDLLFTDWFTDDAEFIETNLQQPLMTAAYGWEDLEEFDTYNSPSNYWYAAYSAIAHANSALEALEQIQTDDTDYKNAVKGEALLCRAYAHFMLSALFCNNYDEASAASDMGIPYVTESEKVLIKDYKRGTLKQTYELIEKDLKDGMALVSDDYYSGSKKYHFTKRAASAFACRFYLYKKEYDASIKYATDVLGEGISNLNLVKNLKDYAEQPGLPAQQRFFVSNADESNIMIIEKTVALGLRHYYGYRTGVQTWYSLYNYSPWPGPDLRLAMSYPGDGARNTIKAGKFGEEFFKESITATSGIPFYVQPVFRGEELFANRAECNLRLGNYQEAVDDLVVFGVMRHDFPANVKVTVKAVIDYYSIRDPMGTILSSPSAEEAVTRLLLSEKRKEFIHEGMRWFDIKRFGLEVIHRTYSGDELVLAKDDKRKVLQIPADASARGLTKNPR